MADSRQKAKAYKCIALVIKRGIQVQVILSSQWFIFQNTTILWKEKSFIQNDYQF